MLQKEYYYELIFISLVKLKLVRSRRFPPPDYRTCKEQLAKDAVISSRTDFYQISFYQNIQRKAKKKCSEENKVFKHLSWSFMLAQRLFLGKYNTHISIHLKSWSNIRPEWRFNESPTFWTTEFLVGSSCIAVNPSRTQVKILSSVQDLKTAWWVQAPLSYLTDYSIFFQLFFTNSVVWGGNLLDLASFSFTRLIYKNQFTFPVSKVFPLATGAGDVSVQRKLLYNN